MLQPTKDNRVGPQENIIAWFEVKSINNFVQ
jgi:hypothetical protein